MSQTSIGTGTSQDFNENPSNPQMGDDPSRTLGAGFGHTPLPPDQIHQTQPEPSTTAGPVEAALQMPNADVPADLVDDELLAPAAPEHPEQALDEMPDGPNVAPSPWEADAARGLAVPPAADPAD